MGYLAAVIKQLNRKADMEKMSDLDLDFKDYSIAFESRSNEELLQMARLFGLMNKTWLVNIGASLGLAAFKLNLPFTDRIVYKTIFPQFCGGRTLLECEPSIDNLSEYGVMTILDYGAEGKETEKDFNLTMNETLRAIEFASRHQSIPVVSTKITGLTKNSLLEKLTAQKPLNTTEEHEYESLLKRIDVICNRASERNVSVFIDAEESWIQGAIDEIVNKMMNRYNKSKAVVYNTFQMYRHDRLTFLKNSHHQAQKSGYILGAKLVRGAYMEKERERAIAQKYRSPINDSKAATDLLYDQGIEYCVNHFEEIASCNASHNAASNMLQAKLIHEKGIVKSHPHLNFCQLYGMSDHITFNLAKAGYNVAKYMPYGPVKDVIPYLIRRTQENTSVTGDMSREYKMIVEEMKRRGIQ